jgi:hypothetical protein
MKQGKLVGYSTTVKMRDNQGEFPMYVTAIGNAKTNTLYVIWFESSSAEWDEMWKIGSVLTSTFAVPDE